MIACQLGYQPVDDALKDGFSYIREMIHLPISFINVIFQLVLLFSIF
jgi:hypothetical protein